MHFKVLEILCLSNWAWSTLSESHMNLLGLHLSDVISSPRGLVAQRGIFLNSQGAGGKLHICVTAAFLD